MGVDAAIASERVRTRTRSTCCYCGVGCGVLVDAEHGPDGSRIVGIEGDPEHPANFGRLCTKGRMLPDTARSLTGRVLHPELRTQRHQPRRRVDWPVALDTVADRLADIVRQHGPDAVAFYVSGQLLTEDYYLFNKLAKGLIGTNNIDSNSRLCMSSAVTAYKLALGADGPPTCYEDLEHARTVLFAGSNMAYAHPVLFRRLEEARERNPDTHWIVVDPRRTDTAAMADLHLAIQPGTDVALFNAMLHHLVWEDLIDRDYIATHTEGFVELKQLLRDYTPRMAADLCGVAAADIVQAAEWFGRSPAALSLYCMGLNQSVHGTDKNLALIHLHLATGQIGRPGAGPFSLTGQPNAMGGREVGAMATMLAAHRDIADAEHRAEVERFWHLPENSLSSRPGLSAVPLFEALRRGKVKAVWIACTNPAHSMPDIGMVREALQQAEYVIVQEAFANTDTVPYADVLLPAATWGEKEGTVTNSERRISRVRPAVRPPADARADWWIANEVARRIEARLASPGTPPMFGFQSPDEIFDEHRRLTAGQDLDVSGLDYARLEQYGPQQWPCPPDEADRAASTRRYVDGRFATANGKAKFHATPYRPVAEETSARFPLRLITGRLRDQWHGMTRTGRVPALFAHSPQPGLRMSPQDAVRRGLVAGDLVRVTGKRGELVLPLELSDEVASGTVFAAMHWSGQFLASGGINEVTQPAIDARSQQPELKHAAVRVEKAAFGWHLLAAQHGDAVELQARVQPLLKACGFAAVSLHAEAEGAGDTAWLVLRAAAESSLSSQWLQALIEALSLAPGTNSLEYSDPRRGLLRRVNWRSEGADHHIDSLLLTDVRRESISEALLDHALSGRAWIGPRQSVFAAGISNRPRDTMVCSCRQVGEAAIRTHIAKGADIDELKRRLGCGTECGSCLPQLTRLCREAVPS
ncbi:molybdopterin-dependent oxidoreductase [Lysobacter sp.]|uniref:nitrate reductase n=1 Tax=Lysobacter sp. TaxID=72226 RepID=UPI002D53A9E0|nr:molybdopterin-dependent oxidoreductase [Lysobacter sp.]HZX76883.1 molybdopterin-dependent oxidoreductase [Lysobacter sp.]